MLVHLNTSPRYVESDCKLGIIADSSNYLFWLRWFKSLRYLSCFSCRIQRYAINSLEHVYPIPSKLNDRDMSRRICDWLVSIHRKTKNACEMKANRVNWVDRSSSQLWPYLSPSPSYWIFICCQYSQNRIGLERNMHVSVSEIGMNSSIWTVWAGIKAISMSIDRAMKPIIDIEAIEREWFRFSEEMAGHTPQARCYHPEWLNNQKRLLIE